MHMRIFYTASYYGKEKYQKYYDMILKAITNTGVEVLSPEKGNYLNILQKKDLKKFKSGKEIHYEAIRRGIQWADAVIIEISNEDFQLGHEATLALQEKKHVLCLSIHEDFSEKIINPYFHGLKYNDYNLEDAVTDFVETVKSEQLNERFNLFLSSRQVTYIESVARRKGMNKSEYIRMLIDEDRK